MFYMIKPLLLIPSSILLRMMGWSYLDDRTLKIIEKHPRIVCVFSHTSYYDFLLLLLYYFSHPQLCHLKTLIKPDYFKTIGYLLRLIGGIPATHINDKNGGAVNRIVEELLQEEKSHFLISPKGTILRGEWRTGYYHIAKQLQCPLVAIGLDYELKQITVCNPILSIYDEYHVKDLLYKDLSTIVPLHPEQENMPIRPYVNKSVVNKLRMFGIIGWLGLISYLLI